MGLKLTDKAQKKITSLQQVMKALQTTYWKEVARGRVVARLLALKQGMVTSRDVIDYMIAEGTFIAGNSEHWVSALWKKPEWEWSKLWAFRYNKSVKTQGGSRPNKLWKLSET